MPPVASFWALHVYGKMCISFLSGTMAKWRIHALVFQAKLDLKDFFTDGLHVRLGVLLLLLFKLLLNSIFGHICLLFLLNFLVNMFFNIESPLCLHIFIKRLVVVGLSKPFDVNLEGIEHSVLVRCRISFKLLNFKILKESLS